jgi:Ca2+-binding RTX toxin-like protein
MPTLEPVRYVAGASRAETSRITDLHIITDGAGIDRLTGGADRDTMVGGTGNDRLAGDAGDDRLPGNAGNDRLTGGGGGRDLVQGGAGADVFVFAGGRDSVTDMGAADRLLLDDALWSDRLSPAQAIDRSADVVRGDTILAFGDGDRLVIEDIRNPDWLARRIDLF